jgi:WD40 repeat protein
MLSHSALTIALLLAPAGAFADTPAKPATDLHGDPLPAGAVARFGTARLLHGAADLGFAFSRDSKLLASKSNRRDVRVWDLGTGRALCRIQLDGVTRMAFAARGLAIADEAGFRLIDPRTGERRKTLDRREDYPWEIAVAPDGKSAAVTWSEAGVMLYDLTAGAGNKPRHLCDDSLVGTCFSADGSVLAGVGDKEIHVWDVRAGRKLCSVTSVDAGSVALSPDGSKVAARGNGKVSLWLTASGAPAPGFKSPEGDYLQLDFAAGGKTLTGLAWDGRVYAWSAETGKQLSVRGEAGPRTIDRVLAPDGVTQAAVLASPVIRVWDVRTNKPRPAIEYRPPLTGVQFVRPGVVAAWGENEAFFFWGTQDGKLRSQHKLPVQRHDRKILSADGKYLAALPYEEKQEVVVYEVATARAVARLAHPDKHVWAAFGQDGRTLVTWIPGDSDERGYFYRLWDAPSGKLLKTIRVLEMGNAVAFAPDGRTVVTESNHLAFFETATGKPRERLDTPAAPEGNKHDESRGAFQFSRDGRTLLVARTRDLYVLDRSVRAPIFQLQTGYHVPAALSPDGRWLATGEGPDVAVRDLRNPRALIEREEFTGHEGPVTALAFAPDGRQLVSCSADGTALVWDMKPVHARAAQRPAPADARRLDECWAALAGDDGEKAGAAMAELERNPDKAVALLAARLAPAAAPPAARVEKWIGDLDSPRFAVRDRAARELEALGELAEPALRQALQKKPSAEAAKRMNDLLNRLEEAEPSPEQRRALRAVEVLEGIGTPAARKVLETLAKGAPAARMTKETLAPLGHWPNRMEERD